MAVLVDSVLCTHRFLFIRHVGPLSRDHGEEVGLGHFGKLGLEFFTNIVLEHDVRGGGTFRFVGIPDFLSPPLPGRAFAVCLESPRLSLGGKEWFIRRVCEELEEL